MVDNMFDNMIMIKTILILINFIVMHEHAGVSVRQSVN